MAQLEERGFNAAVNREDFLTAARIRFSQRRHDEARELFEQAAVALEGVGDLYQAAYALKEAGQTDAARAMFMRAMADAESQGDYDKAVECLTQAATVGTP